MAKATKVARGNATTNVTDAGGSSVKQRQRKQLNRRGTDSKVDRVMQKHFRHIPAQVLENKVVDGFLVRDKIKDLIQAAGTSGRVSNKQWQGVAMNYNQGSSAIELLEQKDGPVRDGLVTALTFLLNENPVLRRQDKFRVYISELRDVLAENELLGLVKSALSSRHTIHESWDCNVLAIMEYFHNARVKTTYPDIFNACEDLFDRVAAKTWSDLRKSKVSWVTFVDSHAAICGLRFDAADLAIVRANLGDLGKAMLALCRLHETGMTGRLLFGASTDLINVKSFSEKLDAALAPLDTGNVAHDVLEKVQAFRDSVQKTQMRFSLCLTILQITFH